MNEDTLIMWVLIPLPLYFAILFLALYYVESKIKKLESETPKNSLHQPLDNSITFAQLMWAMDECYTKGCNGERLDKTSVMKQMKNIK